MLARSCQKLSRLPLDPRPGPGRPSLERVQAPPCASCHGSRGTGVGSVTPPLAGQTQAYLLAQLKRFRSGERKSDTLGLMNGIARRLSNNDLRAAAAYYGSLAIPGSEAQAAGAAK